MTLSYLPVHFSMRFSSPATADTEPLFVLRSMLGKELRSMCCIAHRESCPDCMYNRTCAYAFLFETILPQDNTVVPGRNRASHPFAFTQASNTMTGKSLQDYEFTVTLFGKALSYLPYMYAAFVRAGKNGLFKSRTPFKVTAVRVEDRNILTDEEHLDTNLTANIAGVSRTGEEAGKEKEKKGEILVELKSPLRFKSGGKYTADFSAQDFMSCLYRRAATLCQLYGSFDAGETYTANESLAVTERKLHWTDSTHYSVRQKRAMELGGLTGTLKLAGTFSCVDVELLEFARIANAGKNTNFGLGQLDFWAKWK